MRKTELREGIRGAGNRRRSVCSAIEQSGACREADGPESAGFNDG